MKKGYRRFTAALLCLTIVLGTFALTGCGQKSDRDYYVVYYNLNYEGAATRSFTVQAGNTAPSWKATREGYYLDGWYTDAATEKAYDFSTRIFGDTTLYAKWRVRPGMAAVTFDFDCLGAQNKTIEVEKQSVIQTKYVPEHERLGMTFTGWYTDEQRTDAWDFDNDVVTDSMTLYAGYETDPSFVERDEQGNIKYENVSVTVWNAQEWMISPSKLQALADKFNSEHEGITINVTGTLASQESTMLRLQQTPGFLPTIDNYYSIADVFDVAGIELDYSEYYDGASRECFLDGVMVQLPLLGTAPYVVYNKTLMAQYNDSADLPDSYSELSELLSDAYEGESASKPSFTPMVTNGQWQFREATSYVAFVQNGAPYYTYDSEKGYYNEWSDPAIMEKAVTAMTNTYNLLSPGSELHGSYAYNDDGAAIDAVANGTALMSLVNFRGQESKILGNSNLGVMSLSGLFADGAESDTAKIPVHTVGFAFYKKATNVNSAQMCAAALFADYVAKNAYVFADEALIPLCRTAAAAEEYVSSTNAVTKMIRSVVNPENLITMYGTRALKSIVNSTAAESFILQVLAGDGSDIAERTAELGVQISGQIY